MSEKDVEKLLSAAQELLQPADVHGTGAMEVQKTRYIGALAYAATAIAKMMWEHGEAK